ncbi:UNVERIFIED_CONTAM: hypothetical protein NCL1_55139 [Trichonephila clavipes]
MNLIKEFKTFFRCLIVGIAVLVSKKVFLENYIADGTDYIEDEESMWSYNDTDDKEMFKNLWMTANETLLIQKAQFEGIEKGKSEDDKVQELARCALISEYAKRILKKWQVNVITNKYAVI